MSEQGEMGLHVIRENAYQSYFAFDCVIIA